MKQVIQYQKTGEMSVAELPEPMLKSGGVLVRTAYSLISAGTEKSSVATAQASMVGKARSRPDLVKQVFANVKREGLFATYDKVQNRLDNYKELGYSAAGEVVASASDRFKPGDRVACAGVGFASHAEMNFVPQNLTVPIPDDVLYEEAAFATMGAIALQGVRQAEVRLGENVVVIGLGLLGLLTVQLLKANGCRVVGLDVSTGNFALAQKFGCDVCAVSDFDALQAVESFTRGHGADAIIITAGTKSNQPLEMALEMARKKAKVVVVGAVSMNVPRSPFYEKELDLRISCSYGPGRYDADYEERGIDYPVGYVRWTENRNMQAVLDLISAQKLDVKSLISHRFAIDEALEAYDLITGKKQEKYLGVLLHYPAVESQNGRMQTITLNGNGAARLEDTEGVVGFIGAGNFAQSNLIPPLTKLGTYLKGVVTSKPVNAKSVAEKFGFTFCSTDAQKVIDDSEINTVFIASRHDSHAKYVAAALTQGKHVFVEKPLAVNAGQLQEVTTALANDSARHATLFVGFNRRFSQPFNDIKQFFQDRREPMVMHYRVNAGFLPKTHWSMAAEQGGRIIGEACHFIDCFAYLTGSRPVSVFAQAIASKNEQVENHDNVAVTISYADGSVGNLIYHANGNSGLAKEYCEVHCSGRTAIMDNFKQVTFFQGRRSRKAKYDGGKGHSQEVTHFIKVVTGKEKAGLHVDDIIATTTVSFKILESLRTGQPTAL
ncbi:MAG: bi-domain-containing oxidoreductase [Deferribacteres bacterium]|nr:bi-domain-containing oxidoreductase [Deferribacteres bacterium]